MARPDPALLVPARYPFHCDIETRYRDLDSNLHVNNGVMASLLEEARVRYHRVSGFGSVSADPELSVMVASVSIDYLGESHFPAPITAHVGAARLGNSSYDLFQLMTQEENVVVFARATMVCLKNGKPFVISDHHREAAKLWMLAL